MGIHDPTLQRVSACPVHFLWDGRGSGRLWVRLGFLGFLTAAMFFAGAQMTQGQPLHLTFQLSLHNLAIACAATSSAVYLVGQALTFLAMRAARISLGARGGP